MVVKIGVNTCKYVKLLQILKDMVEATGPLECMPVTLAPQSGPNAMLDCYWLSNSTTGK